MFQRFQFQYLLSYTVLKGKSGFSFLWVTNRVGLTYLNYKISPFANYASVRFILEANLQILMGEYGMRKRETNANFHRLAHVECLQQTDGVNSLHSQTFIQKISFSFDQPLQISNFLVTSIVVANIWTACPVSINTKVYSDDSDNLDIKGYIYSPDTPSKKMFLDNHRNKSNFRLCGRQYLPTRKKHVSYFIVTLL